MQTKPDWYYKQSAVIPYRIKGNEAEVLLITTRKNRNWIIPKGIIELGTTPEESAVKEAMEEAGVVGLIGRELIGEYKYDKWGGTCRVKVFPFLVKKILDKWPEDNIRLREWFSLDAAVKKVKNSDLSGILENFKQSYLNTPTDN